MVNKSRNQLWLDLIDIDKNIESITILLELFKLEPEQDFRFTIFQGTSALSIKKKSLKQDMWYTIYPNVETMELQVVLNKSTKSGDKHPFLKDKITGEVLSFGGTDCWYEVLKTIFPWKDGKR